MMTTLLLTLGIFGFVMLIMAVGVIFGRPCLRGSCGGPEVLAPGGLRLSCATCPNRKKQTEETAADSRRLPVFGEDQPP